MTWNNIINLFLQKIAIIKSLNPTYRQPGDGSDGTCDCIGLIIGAIRRMGLKWTGIHGTNWAARKEFVELKNVNSASDLELGDVVLKGRAKGHPLWRLPSRYQKNGKYYNRDLTDYYHAGVVTSVNPLKITHMSAKMTVDTKVGQWKYHGKLNILAKASGTIIQKAENDAKTPSTGSVAVVVAPSGKTVNLRMKPSLTGSLIERVPLDTKVEIISPGETWAKIKVDNKTGYMMAKYLDIVGDGKGQY